MVKKKIICLAVLATLFCLNRNDFKSVSAEPVEIGTFDTTAWKNWNNVALVPDSAGNITCSNGRLFCGTKYPVTYDSAANTMTVSVDFSFIKENDKYVSYQWMPLISNTAIAQDTDYNTKIGTVDNMLGFKCLYADAAAWTNKNFRFSAAAGNGSWKNDYYTTLDPKDGAKHNLSFILDANGVYATFDGATIVAKGTTNPYYYCKASGSKYTIADFLSDGQPSVYFAIDVAQNYATTIYKPVEKSEEEHDFQYPIFDNTQWFNWNNAALKPGVNGNIVCSNGRLYNKTKMPVSYDKETNTMTVDVDWSFIKNNDDKLTYQWMPLISYSPITQDTDYNTKIGNVDNMLGFKCLYKDATDWGNGRFRFGACAGNGAWKNDYYATINPTDGAKHRLSFVLDSVGVYAKLDGNVIVKASTSSPYYFQKSSGDNYTINDFIVDGQPSVYFAIDVAQNYATTIYKPAIKPVEFNSTKWFTYTDENYFNPADGNAVNMYTGTYYDEKLDVEDYDAEAQIMKVSVEFSINCPESNTNQFIPIFTSEPFKGNWTSVTKRIGGEYSVPTLAARMYYQNDDQYASNSFLIRACDYKNYETADRLTIKPTEGSKHNIALVLTSKFVYMEVDGITLGNSGTPYKLAKDETGTNLYTINDFLKDGEPSIYFGVMRSSLTEGMKIYNSTFTNQDIVDALEDSMVTTEGGIRFSEPKGMKFVSSVAPAYYNYLVEEIGEANIESGTLMLPKSKLGSNELKVNTSDVLKGKRTTWTDENKKVYTASLVNIPEAKYDEVIVARAYMSFTWDGATYTIYGEAIEKSIKEIATASLNDYDKETSATAESPATRENEKGFNFLVSIDGTSYVYSKFSQAYIDVLKTFAL